MTNPTSSKPGRPRTGSPCRYFYVSRQVRGVFDAQFGEDSMRFMLPLLAIRGICASGSRWGSQAVALARSLRKWLDRELDASPLLQKQRWFLAELEMIDADICKLMQEGVK